jgi:hypothetical protein
MMDAQPLFDRCHGMPGAGAGINKIEQVLGVLLMFWRNLHGGLGFLEMEAWGRRQFCRRSRVFLQFSRTLVLGEKALWHMGRAILG